MNGYCRLYEVGDELMSNTLEGECVMCSIWRKIAKWQSGKVMNRFRTLRVVMHLDGRL